MSFDDEEGNPLDSYSTEAKTNMRGRSQRMDGLLRHIQKNGPHIPKKKLIAIFCIKEHVSKSTVYTYLEEYLEAELVVQRKGHIMMADVAQQMEEEGSSK